MPNGAMPCLNYSKLPHTNMLISGLPLNKTQLETGYFTATQVGQLYNIPAPNTSVNIEIGVFSFGGGLIGTVDPVTGVLTNGDLQSYWSSINPGAPQPTVIVKPLYGATNNISLNDEGSPVNSTLENTLDIQIIGGICPSPNLTIILYIMPALSHISSFFNDYLDNKTSVIGSHRPKIINISWAMIDEQFYLQNDMFAINESLKRASENGINICCSTGDNGSNADNGINRNGTNNGTTLGFPSSSQYVIAVGGTSVSLPDGVYNSNAKEIAWNNGGGGVSQFFPTPSYQTLVNAPSRSVPDISALSLGVVILVNNTTATDEINKIKRYALEIDSVKYYKDVDVETLIEKNEIISPNYDVYCFYEDNREYWAVKTINNFTEI
jgi:kumamolisin